MGLYIHFCKLNYETDSKEIKNKSVIIVSLSLCLQWCIQSFLGKLFTAGGLGMDVMPSMDPGRSPGGGAGNKVTRCSEDLDSTMTYFWLRYTLCNMYLMFQLELKLI